MFIDETHCVDESCQPDNDKLTVLIVDLGITPDPGERNRLFFKKLETYDSYLSCEDERGDGIGSRDVDVEVENVTIKVLWEIEPTAEMKAMTKLVLGSGKTVPIVFEKLSDSRLSPFQREEIRKKSHG